MQIVDQRIYVIRTMYTIGLKKAPDENISAGKITGLAVNTGAARVAQDTNLTKRRRFVMESSRRYMRILEAILKCDDEVVNLLLQAKDPA